MKDRLREKTEKELDAIWKQCQIYISENIIIETTLPPSIKYS